jgi:hypothetical protein
MAKFKVALVLPGRAAQRIGAVSCEIPSETQAAIKSRGIYKNRLAPLTKFMPTNQGPMK